MFCAIFSWVCNYCDGLCGSFTADCECSHFSMVREESNSFAGEKDLQVCNLSQLTIQSTKTMKDTADIRWWYRSSTAFMRWLFNSWCFWFYSLAFWKALDSFRTSFAREGAVHLTKILPRRCPNNENEKSLEASSSKHRNQKKRSLLKHPKKPCFCYLKARSVYTKSRSLEGKPATWTGSHCRVDGSNGSTRGC